MTEDQFNKLVVFMVAVANAAVLQTNTSTPNEVKEELDKMYKQLKLSFLGY
jgi:hypothetical protein